MARNSLRDAEIWIWLENGGSVHDMASLLKEDLRGRDAITGGNRWFVAYRCCDISSTCGVGLVRPGVKADSWPQRRLLGMVKC